MMFEYQKIREIITEHKLSHSRLAKNLGVSRSTLWAWERGERIPREKNIRKLAYLLNIPVSEISCLEDELEQTEVPLAKYTDSWAELTLPSSEWEANSIQLLSNGVDSLIKTLKRAFIITNALINSTNFMFYIKDTNQKYITVNSAFLKQFKLTSDYKVIGLLDESFFSTKRSIANTLEDKSVLINGKTITREDFTPGSRRKKWSLITKKAIFDSEEKLCGIIGCFIDITERKKAEKVREILEINVKYMDYGLAIVDLETNHYLYINKSYEDIYSISAEELYKDTNIWLSRVHPEDRDNLIKATKEKHYPNYLRDQIYRLKQPNKSYKTIEVKRSEITFQNKKCLVIISKECKKNIEKRHILEKYLNSLNKLTYEEKNKLLTMMISQQ